jgi:phage replication O-like protein O
MKLQIENGHTKIVNELLEQLVKACLLGSEYQVIFFVIRKTYGWQKTEDFVSLTQFELGTSLSRPTIVKTIKNLVYRNILVKRSLPGRHENAYKINKYWNTWVVNTTLLVKNSSKSSKAGLTKVVKRGLHTKEKKENKRKNIENLEAYKKLKERWGKKNV